MLRIACVIVVAAACQARSVAPEIATISMVVSPTSLDPAIAEVRLRNGNAGRHYFCNPVAVERWNGHLLLFIVGTDEDPSETYELAEYACSLGYAAMSPMYKHTTRPRDVCGDDPACFERVRREIIEGKDLAPDPIAVDVANSLWYRIDTFAAHLAGRIPAVWAPIRDRLARRDLRTVVLAGFSQGAGHAPLIAHDFEAARLIMLGGVGDRIRPGTPEHAPVDWIANWARSQPATPGDRFFGFNHANDDTTRPIEWNASYDALGVPGASCEFSERGYPANCHRITIPATECHQFRAHGTPVVRSFGSEESPCKLDGPRWSNFATWRYLLTLR